MEAASSTTFNWREVVELCNTEKYQIYGRKEQVENEVFIHETHGQKHVPCGIGP